MLLTGGNLGNIRQTLADIRTLAQDKIGKLRAESSIYESPAWGFKSEFPFLNQALVLQTALSAREVLAAIWDMEAAYGKDIRSYFDTKGRKIKSEKKIDGTTVYRSRSIDIDILFYGNDVIDDDYLTVPHPLLPYRRFVLEPLNEIMPDFRHPVSGKTVRELYDSL